MNSLDIKPLDNNELYLSGIYGKKIFSYLKSKDNSLKPPFFKVVAQVDGGEIYIDSDNLITSFGFFDTVILQEIKDKIDFYIKTKILSVENIDYREKIISVANYKISRRSQFHILNIELLSLAAIKKPEIFNSLYFVVKDRDVYSFLKDDYEFYLFAIYDSPNKEFAQNISQTLIEESGSIIMDEDGYRCSRKTAINLEKSRKELILNLTNSLNEDSISMIRKNIDKIKF